MKHLAAAALATALTGTAFAAPIAVTDGDFEDFNTGGVLTGLAAATASGWSPTAGGGNGIWNDEAVAPSYQFPGRTNNNALFLSDGTGAFTKGNDIGTNAIAGEEYTLTVDFLDRFNGSEGNPRGYRLEILAGDAGTPIVIADSGELIYSFDGVETSVELQVSGIASGAADGQALWIRLSSVDGSSPALGNDEAFYDNVRLDGPVPEPSSLALLALGGLAIARRRRG